MPGSCVCYLVKDRIICRRCRRAISHPGSPPQGPNPALIDAFTKSTCLTKLTRCTSGLPADLTSQSLRGQCCSVTSVCCLFSSGCLAVFVCGFTPRYAVCFLLVVWLCLFVCSFVVLHLGMLFVFFWLFGFECLLVCLFVCGFTPQ